MATQTLDIPSIVGDVLDWIDRTFGYVETQEFAAPVIEIGDIVTDNVSGVEWSVYAIHQEAPYAALPVEYAGYTLAEPWAYLVRRTPSTAHALTDYAPVRYLIDCIERGE